LPLHSFVPKTSPVVFKNVTCILHPKMYIFQCHNLCLWWLQNLNAFKGHMNLPKTLPSNAPIFPLKLIYLPSMTLGRKSLPIYLCYIPTCTPSCLDNVRCK
jgi:hypothetical protein